MRLNPGADLYLSSPSPVRTVLALHSSPPSPPCPSCPPRGRTSHLLTLLLTAASILLSAWTILGPIAAPGGTVFALLVLIILALLGGQAIKYLGVILSKIFRINISLPPLLGMLLVGIALKNVPYNFGQFGRAECSADLKNESFVDSINDLEDIEEHGSFKRSISQSLLTDYEDSAVERSGEKEMEEDCTPKYIGHELDPLIARQLRTLCLTVILIRAGLEMDPVALWRLSGMVLRATFIPCLVEAAAVAALSFLLLDFPITVGLMLGFVLAAVSPAVIIPCLISIREAVKVEKIKMIGNFHSVP